MTLEMLTSEVLLVLQGRLAELPRALPYRNFIAHVASTPLSEHERYFHAQLGDFNEPSAPFDIVDVQGNGTEVQEAHLVLTSERTGQIRQVARRQAVSTATLFHLAWAQVLGRCCGRDDVVFGTLLLGRMHGSGGANRALGMFINTLPIRLRVGNLSVSEALGSTFAQLTGLLDHEQAPLALAQRCSGVALPLPLFSTLLNFRHSRPTPAGDAQSQLDGMHILGSKERTNYPITISIDDRGKEFAITVQCVPGIDPERIAHYFSTAMASLTEALEKHPELPMSDLAILPNAERDQLLVAFNSTTQEYPSELLLHQLFEEQAAR
ncbi:condensation domain-containing protein, partial [Massilia aurea]|uniref:condensation domain-containing protein n=1 Tax=Massilia aurea TaxID=373040 RepID=UPI002161175A